MSAFDKMRADLTAKKDFAGLAACMRAVNNDRLFILFLTDYTVEDLEARIASKKVHNDDLKRKEIYAWIDDLDREEIHACELAINILRGNSFIDRDVLVSMFADLSSDEELNAIIVRTQQDFMTKVLLRDVEGADLAAIDHDLDFDREFYDAASEALALRANESL